jgi:hypothetical protein
MRLFGMVTLLLALLASASGVGAGAPARAAYPSLYLRRATLTPATLPASPIVGAVQIVQLSGPITTSDRAMIERTGVEILEYLPEYAYVVRGTPSQFAEIAHLPQVLAVLPLTAADKMAPALLTAAQQGRLRLADMQIIPWPGQASQLQSDLRAFALRRDSIVDHAALLRVAALDAVRWIEPLRQPRLQNDVARSLMHIDTAAWQRSGLYGAGQIVAVADTGLDTGNPDTLSPDFAGRIVATHTLRSNEWGDPHGHGTHVIGSILGSGRTSGADPATRSYANSFAGVAPEAQLVLQAFEADAEGAISGLPDDLYGLYAQAYQDGARIHSNSWGSPTGPLNDWSARYGGYTYDSQRTDAFLWDHPDMSILFAAGNEARDGTLNDANLCVGSDGVIDEDSLLAPATAKNVVSVGAAESVRSAAPIGQMLWFLFDFVSFCYSALPIASDLVADNPNGMAAISSRGPTDDGRIKPDIVAPATGIISNRSRHPSAQTLWYAYLPNLDYVYSGGTSMATALTSGAATLLREWLMWRGHARPSAAVVKALLLNTTASMGAGQYGTGVNREIPAQYPNPVNGWGRVDLGFLNTPAPYHVWVDDATAGLSTGQRVEYTHSPSHPLIVLDSAQPLRVTLAWTDYPASLAASRQLVNDLDLVVIGPDGAEHYGNGVATGDRLNNVESVVIEDPPLGEYRVQVRAVNVPMQTQPYALAVSGALSMQGLQAVTKRSEQSEVRPGELITYTLLLDTGAESITQPISLYDRMPAATTFVHASDGGVLRSDGVVQWQLPPLPAQQYITRTLTVRAEPWLSNGARIINDTYWATPGFEQADKAPPVAVSVVGQHNDLAMLALTKQAEPSTFVEPSGLITYTLSVSLTSGSITGVELIDEVPAHTQFVAASGTYEREEAETTFVRWELGDISGDQHITRTLTVRVDPQAEDGTIIRNHNYRVTARNAPSRSNSAVEVVVKAPERTKLYWLSLVYGQP